MESEPDAALSDLLKELVAAAASNYSTLAPRIRTFDHGVKCDNSKINIRVHYPSIRQGKPTVQELIDAIYLYITNFSLPRTQINELLGKYSVVDPHEFMKLHAQMMTEASSLFIRAQKATNRNGEGGELLLYVLTEWILGAPQILAKMSLKTNSMMPVYGSDGVHVRYCEKSKRLIIYWGESKLHADVGGAISSAAKSIREALSPEKSDYEIKLVRRHIDFAGLSADAKAALLNYLNPMHEAYNERHDVITCLIAFDFSQYASLGSADAIDDTFQAYVKAELGGIASKLSSAFETEGISEQDIEIFLLPLPSVGDYRDRFQKKIGWSS